MSTTSDHRATILSDALTQALPLFERFLTGFDDTNRTAQAPGMPNHAAWTLGHLAIYQHRAADLLQGHDDPQALPPSDFVIADGRAGTSERFDTESVAFASVPVDDPALYPSWDRAQEIHAVSWRRLMSAVRDGDAAMLNRPVRWGAGSFPAEHLVVRMIMHLGTHTGQIADLRRGLGMPRAIG